MNIQKSHQTIVFVRQGANSERVSRFVSSLNRSGGGDGGTIKADIYTVTDSGAVVPGLVLDNAAQGLSDEALRELGADYGYNLTVVVG